MSYGPTEAELVRGRDDLASLLWERCRIRRRVTPGSGAFADVPGLEAVPCRLAARGGAIEGGLVLAAADPRGDMTLSLPAGTDIRPDDQALVTGAALTGTRRFEARFVEPRQAFLMRVRGTVSA